MKAHDQRANWSDLDLPEELESLRSLIEESLLPCLVLKPTKPSGGDSVLGSRLGGSPSTGRSFAWPMGEKGPMTFLGQLDFEELSRAAIPELGLPEAGTLSLFYDLSRATGGGHATQVPTLFHLHYATGELSSPAPPEGAQVLHRQELPVSALDLTMPRERDRATQSWPGFGQTFDPTTSAWTGPRPEYRGIYDGRRNQVRGHANWVQDDPRIAGVRIDAGRLDELADPQGWSLLWQLAYQPSWGLRFYSEIDASRIYVLIRDEDLAAKDFSRTYLSWQCV